MSISKFPTFDLVQYLEDLGKKTKVIKSDEGHTEVCIDCHKCVENGEARPDTRQRLYINMRTGRYYCFNCSWSGSLPFLIQDLSSVNSVGAIKILKGKVNGELNLHDGTHHVMVGHLYDEGEDEEEDDADIEMKPMQLPYGFESFENSKKRTKFHEYLDQRGIPLEYAIAQGWGFCRHGYTANRLIVPFWYEEECVFWQARDILNEAHPDWGDKKKYRKVLNPRGASKSHVLYQFDTARSYEKIVLVEGFIDATKVGPQAVAINGKRLHSSQVQLLLRTKAQEVIVCLDRDSWTDGRMGKPCSMERTRALLAAAGYRVQTVKLPKNKDPGSFPIGVLPRILKL